MGKSITVQTTMEIHEEDLVNLLANAIETPDDCGCAYYKATDEKAYEEARSQLISERKPDADDQITLVEIFARMLLNGGTLQCLDPESDWHWSGHEPGEMLWKAQIIMEGCVPVGGKWHTVGLQNIVEGIQKYGKDHICNDLGTDLHKIAEDGDFWDADAIIQYAMYGEVVYG